MKRRDFLKGTAITSTTTSVLLGGYSITRDDLEVTEIEVNSSSQDTVKITTKIKNYSTKTISGKLFTKFATVNDTYKKSQIITVSSQESNKYQLKFNAKLHKPISKIKYATKVWVN